jgi:glycosyltransferase involved in cell wall biosynthesis
VTGPEPSLGKPDLVLLTSAFPFDGSESVLAGELAITASRFRRIFIVPSCPGEVARDLPPNAVVADVGWGAGWSRSEKLRMVTSTPALKVLSTTLRQAGNWRAYGFAPRSYLDILAINILKARSLASLITSEQLRNALFYDYWFENSTLAIALLRRAGTIRCAVARAHRFDVFDSSWAGPGRVPFREFKVKHLDAIFPVSDDATHYMRSELDRHRGGLARERDKIRTARLGVPLPHQFPPVGDGRPLVVSCAALLERKRVHRIPEVLGACNIPLHWVHFGDGPERSRVEAAAASLPSTVEWELRGQVDNEVVRSYYATHRVAALLSLSTSEGVPVSMMEAQSFGIPVVALAVGGIPELVVDGSGLLLAPDASTAEVARAVTEATSPARFDPDDIRRALADRFDASINYARFAELVTSVWERTPELGNKTGCTG